MNLLILSDLHLEFAGNADFAPPAEAVAAADLIILAGDIHNGTAGIEWAARDLASRPVLYVPGNHEYYGTVRGPARDAMRAAAAQTANVRLLDLDALVERGVRFVGATLWTDFDLFGPEHRAECEAAAERYITDFELIREATAAAPEPRRFRAADAIALHAEARAFVDAELSRPHDGPTVVVTHHAPSAASVVARYRTIATSAAFASRLEALVERHRPRFWIHGHMHNSLDYALGATRVVCNPMGYPARNGKAKENGAFDPGLLLEI